MPFLSIYYYKIFFFCYTIDKGCFFFHHRSIDTFLSLRGSVRRDVGRGKEAAPIAELARPPVLVRLVGDGDDVAAAELKLAMLLKPVKKQRL